MRRGTLSTSEDSGVGPYDGLPVRRAGVFTGVARVSGLRVSDLAAFDSVFHEKRQPPNLKSVSQIPRSLLTGSFETQRRQRPIDRFFCVVVSETCRSAPVVRSRGLGDQISAHRVKAI